MSFTVGLSLNGVDADLLSEAARAATRAQRLGFDSIEFAEAAHDVFLPCVLAAEHSTAEIHTSIAVAFPRSPMVTAMAAWDLQRYSNGRFVLGLGTQVKGHNERRFSTPWTAPAPRMREYVQSLRAIWHTFQTGEALDFVGKSYAFTLMTPNFNPGPVDCPPPAIHLAAVNPYMARVAGRYCDGIKLHPFHSPEYLRDVLFPAIDEGLAAGGRSRSEFRVCGGGLIATGPSWRETEQAVAQVRRWISFYGSTRAYAPVLEHHGWHDVAEQLRELSLKGRWDEMRALVTDDMVQALATVAPYGELPAGLAGRYAGAVDHVTFTEDLAPESADEAVAELVAELQD
jgi:probable F420-dependent oxidoreductase